jgi:hypothetical protein
VRRHQRRYRRHHLSLPRLRFFDVTVVTSDFTTIFAVFFELIFLVLSQSISLVRFCFSQHGK